MSEQFQALIRDFASHVGIEDTGEIETTSIITIDGVAVEIVYRETDEDEVEEVILMAALGTPAQGQERVIYRALLEGNLFGAGTGGGSLAVVPETGEAVLTLTALLRELDGEALAEALDEFVDIAAFWRQLIVAAAEVEKAPDMPAASGHITP